MNQQCKVCGEPAAGFHFGAFTCEGCKSFFGRTYNNLSSISECKNGGICIINKKNRTACKACRLRKCLMVGMSKSGSRYGRRSNWFKIHCLLQEQNNSSVSQTSTTPASAAQTLSTTSHFGPHFLPNFIPGLQNQQLVYAKEHHFQQHPLRDHSHSPPNLQDDLALQSHLLHVAIAKQQNQQKQQQHQKSTSSCDEKSPKPEDVLHNQLKLLAWQKEEEDRLVQHHQRTNSTAISLKNSSPPSTSGSLIQYKDLVSSSSLFAVNLAAVAAAAGQKEGVGSSTMSSSSLEVFRPFLPIYKQRKTDSSSDSSTSSTAESVDEHDESRSDSVFGFTLGNSDTDKKQAEEDTICNSPPEQMQEICSFSSSQKINATVTLATDYGFIYPPVELITPGTTHLTLRGGDLLLASPSPGGLAVEQIEPIDLSIRSGKVCHKHVLSVDEDENNDKGRCENDSEPSVCAASRSDYKQSAQQESTAKNNPLDLSLDMKRTAAEISL